MTLREISFIVKELAENGNFAEAFYEYKIVKDGICIQRNGTRFLELIGNYCILKTVSCGICCTDLARKYLPYPLPQIIGHEVVVEIPPEISEFGAEFAVVEINDAHSSHDDVEGLKMCRYCITGLPTQCPARLTMGINLWPGGLAPYIIVPRNNLIHIPPDSPLSGELAVIVEPFAAALHAAKTVVKRQGDRIGVLGAGKLGLMVIAALNLIRNSNCNFSITALMRNGKTKERAFKLGADNVIVTGGGEPDSTFDVVFDTTGTSNGLEIALAISQREIHIKSTHGQNVLGLDHITELVVAELSILPFSLENLLFRFGGGEAENPNIYVSPSLSTSLISDISATHRSVYQMSISDADNYLENENGGCELVNEGSPLPRFDLAICQTLDEIDGVISPSKLHDKSLVKPRGAILVVGNELSIEIVSVICGKQLKLTSSRCGKFEEAIALLTKVESKDILSELLRLVTHKVSIEKLEHAFDLVSGETKSEKEVMKVMISS